MAWSLANSRPPLDLQPEAEPRSQRPPPQTHPPSPQAHGQEKEMLQALGVWRLVTQNYCSRDPMLCLAYIRVQARVPASCRCRYF